MRNKTFKAGDFTSGKMGEIFKHCFQDKKTTIISHKQFGELAMIPESYIEFMVIKSLRQNEHFREFMKSEYDGGEVVTNEGKLKKEIISDYLCIKGGCFDWAEVLFALFLTWSHQAIAKDE